MAANVDKKSPTSIDYTRYTKINQRNTGIGDEIREKTISGIDIHIQKSSQVCIMLL